jgi:hypothetical protein
VPEETVWHTATEVSRTLVSPAYGAFQPAPLVRCRARVLLPTETATALLPRHSAIQPEGEPLTEPRIDQQLEPRLASMAQAAVQVYELDYHDESHGFFFALGDEAWSFGPWSSDARVLYCRVEKEELAHLIVVGGTFVAWQGQPFLKTAGPSAFFEWRKQDALMNATPGEFSATALFEKLTGGLASSSAGVDHSSSNQGSSDQDSSDQGSSTYAEKH